MALTKAQMRKKYGLDGQPIKATRVLIRKLDYDFGMPAHAILAINDQAGTFTAANVYGYTSDGHLGKNYDAEGMTHPLPEPSSDKWKKWRKRGYEEGRVTDFDVLELLVTKAEEEIQKVKA